MYPDTDSAPIPLEDENIREIEKKLPVDVSIRMGQLQKWEIPLDTYHYILKNNLVPLIEKIVTELEIEPKLTGTLFGHTLKHWEGQYPRSRDFCYDQIYEMLKFLKNKGLDYVLAKKMIPVIYQYPNMDYDSVLTSINFTKVPIKDILEKIPFLKDKFKEIVTSKDENAEVCWIMGELRESALGNVPLAELKEDIEKMNESLKKNKGK
jgi:glutamyl-tRNA(Gln) amidotransferase subunit E